MMQPFLAILGFLCLALEKDFQAAGLFFVAAAGFAIAEKIERLLYK